MNDREDRTSSIWRGAAAGAIGGAVGSSTMVLFNHLLASTGFGREDLGRRQQHRRLDAKPNDADGTIPDEPATEKAASNLTELATGTPLSERGQRTLGPVLHHVFGAAVGAVYGAAAARAPQVAAGGGLPYSALVWIGAAETGLPLVGLSRFPAAYPWTRHVASLLSHFAFGATLETIRRTMTRR